MTKVDEVELRASVRSWLSMPSGLNCRVVSLLPKAVRDPRPDLVGITHVGGELNGDFELVTALVRPSTTRFVSVAGETSAQRLQADRVYLACFTADERFTENQIEVALQLGIGLLRIDNNLKCHRDVPAPIANPVSRTRRELLGQIGFVECQLCGVAFSWQACEQSNTESGYVFWNEIWADHHGRLRNETVSDRRYLCPDCARNLNMLSSLPVEDS